MPGSLHEHPPVGEVGPFPLDQVYCEDCVAAMRRLPENSINLAIADPPYNLSKGGKWSWDSSAGLPGFGGDWNKVMANWDDMPLADYVSFTLAWLRELKRVVRPEGSLWVHGTYHNAGVINFCMQLLGLEIINEVVWYKRNSFPNLSGRRLTASHETVLWAHTGADRKYRFNYEAAKALECPEDGLKAAGKQMRTVWDIPNNKRRTEIAHGKHPTQKPLRLLLRMLAISAQPGDAVLVPFAGAGSECAAAREFGARFIGFEVEDEYWQVCRRRLNLTDPSAHTQPAADAHKVEERSLPVPSLIKWTGSKRAQAASITGLLPEYERYIEPFVGGGALLYLAGRETALAGDLYGPLIDLWKLVQDDPERVIADYTEQWSSLQEELNSLDSTQRKKRSGIPKYYYRVRRRFNAEHGPLDLNFLMRTCVNGIVRFNEAGEFNNSFHLSRRGMAPRRFAGVVRKWHTAIANVAFVCQDYEATLADARPGDFVYLDPPYAGNQQRYVQDLDLTRFFKVLKRLNSQGVKWALSFDGKRGDADLTHAVPSELYKRQLYLHNGNSAVNKVLNGPLENVVESLYLNY